MKKIFTFSDGKTVNRLGYGTMQLTGEGVFGPYKNHDHAVHLMKTVFDSSVNFIDTADSYGPLYANSYIKESLHNYSGNNEIFIASKIGFTRQGPDIWVELGHPDYLRQQVEFNLLSLGLDKIDLMQLHRLDSNFSLEEQVSVLKEYQNSGKIGHIGLSQVTVDQIKEVQKFATIASVQNRYNLIDRADEEVLQYCEENNIAFIPWFPLATGGLTGDDNKTLNEIALAHNATSSQIALSWLLHKSPVILPIPGTSSIEHLHSNNLAGDIELTELELQKLNGIGK